MLKLIFGTLFSEYITRINMAIECPNSHQGVYDWQDMDIAYKLVFTLGLIFQIKLYKSLDTKYVTKMHLAMGMAVFDRSLSIYAC